MKEVKHNLFGVMQGRLLAKYQGRYQAHPVGYWQQEFPVARDLGLDCIEFILDFNDVEENPLMHESGLEEVEKLILQTGVSVKTVCADYFMEAPLHSESPDVAAQSLQILNRLIDAAIRLGVSDIVIPCVDQSSLGGQDDKDRFVAAVAKVAGRCNSHHVNLSLETDLGPADFVTLIEQIGQPCIKVNYDIGNSAALGYDPEEELARYGHLISDIHIKDRNLNGGPVLLGAGDAQFEVFFHALKKLNYTGPFIMQAYRDEEGVGIFTSQMAWVAPYLRSLHD